MNARARRMTMLAKSAAPATGGGVAQLPGPAAVGRVPVPSSATGARFEPTPAAPYTETLAFGDRLTAAEPKTALVN